MLYQDIDDLVQYAVGGNGHVGWVLDVRRRWKRGQFLDGTSRYRQFAEQSKAQFLILESSVPLKYIKDLPEINRPDYSVEDYIANKPIPEGWEVLAVDPGYLIDEFEDDVRAMAIAERAKYIKAEDEKKYHRKVNKAAAEALMKAFVTASGGKVSAPGVAISSGDSAINIPEEIAVKLAEILEEDFKVPKRK